VTHRNKSIVDFSNHKRSDNYKIYITIYYMILYLLNLFLLQKNIYLSTLYSKTQPNTYVKSNNLTSYSKTFPFPTFYQVYLELCTKKPTLFRVHAHTNTQNFIVQVSLSLFFCFFEGTATWLSSGNVTLVV